MKAKEKARLFDIACASKHPSVKEALESLLVTVKLAEDIDSHPVRELEQVFVDKEMDDQYKELKEWASRAKWDDYRDAYIFK